MCSALVFHEFVCKIHLLVLAPKIPALLPCKSRHCFFKLNFIKYQGLVTTCQQSAVLEITVWLLVPHPSHQECQLQLCFTGSVYLYIFSVTSGCYTLPQHQQSHILQSKCDSFYEERAKARKDTKEILNTHHLFFSALNWFYFSVAVFVFD